MTKCCITSPTTKVLSAYSKRSEADLGGGGTGDLTEPPQLKLLTFINLQLE